MRRLSGYGPSLIVLATAMLVLLLGPSAVQQFTYKQTQVRMIQASQNLQADSILGRISQAYRDMATFVEPSVVHISAQLANHDRRAYTNNSAGSGWIYDSDGHVVTNYHVVKDTDRIEVQLASGELREAVIVGYDESTDIAVLKIPSGRLHPATLANLDDPVRQGDLVFAFGSPFDFRFSISSGIVSGKGRHANVIHDDVGPGYENFIQVDAAINPGNSGGPLTNHHGYVIGMNTAIATVHGSSLEEGQFAGIGLAIPLEMIEPVVDQIIDKGFVEKGYLGVHAELNKSVAQQFGFIGDGVLITWIDSLGPAAGAGVQVNDIVMEVNGKSIASMSQLRSSISTMLPGDTAELTIWRPDMENGTGKQLTIDVPLARLDRYQAAGPGPESSPLTLPQLGIAQMTTAAPQRAEQLGVPFHQGVLIEGVEQNSNLAKQIEPGTTIIAVMNYPIVSVEQFVAMLRLYDLHQGVYATVIHPDGSIDNTVKLKLSD